MLTDRFWSYFFEIYEAIPARDLGSREHRAGPGPAAAPDVAPPHPRHRLRFGNPDHRPGTRHRGTDCGRRQSRSVRRAARKTGRRTALGARIKTQVGDMNDITFPDGSFEVIWCEGAIVIINGSFAKGLSAWRRLLVPGGHMALSELCWLRDHPPAEVKAFFEAEGADVADLDARRHDIANGYRLVGDFVLPAVGWWENYYVPLGDALERFLPRTPATPKRSRWRPGASTSSTSIAGIRISSAMASS